MLLVALAVWVCVTSSFWLLGPLATILTARAIGRLEDEDPPALVDPPKLSVVIPACNEAETIEPALASIRAQSYANLELILIDDRSTDATGAIIDRIAAEDPRVITMHLTELPEGWLGKVHALHRGVEKATGEWVLFTDADVRFHPGALEKSVAWVVEHEVDHLFLFPRVFSASLLVEIMVGATLRAISLSQRPWRAMDPDSEAAIGSGAFNLVRRAAFDRTPGFEWLKMEVADDLGLAHMMTKHGGRAGALTATETVEVEWYRSLRGLFEGMEKNAFAQIARFSVWRGLAAALLATLASLGPVAAFVVPIPWLWIAGVLAFAAHLTTVLLLRGRSSIRPLAVALSAPFGDLLSSVLLIRASILGWRRGGLVWRGTLYPSARLRAGMRIRF